MNVQQITDYIFLNDTHLKGDLGVVIGTYDGYPEAARLAAKLYLDGFVPKLMLTGGFNQKGFVESECMLEVVLKMGVPHQDVLLENKSTNTSENILCALPVIDAALGFKNIHTVTAILKNYHARRAMMTLRKCWPIPVAFNVAAYDAAYYGFNRENWSMSELGRRKVLGELHKIKKYGKLGYLEELEGRGTFPEVSEFAF